MILEVRKDRLTATSVTFCVIGLLFNTTVGALAALSFLVGGIVLSILYYEKIIEVCTNNKLILSLPFLAILSFMWSEVSVLAIRGGIQLMLTTFFALLIASAVRTHTLIKILAIGCCLTMLLSLISARYVINGMTGEFNLVGIFDSKNFLSMNAALSCITGAHLFKDTSINYKFRVLGAFLCMLALLVLIKTHSLGALVTTTMAILLTIIISLYSKFKISKWLKNKINWVSAFIIITLLFGLISFFNSPTFDDVMYSIGKDPTLTGRTFIWSLGWGSILENPLLGVGFQSAFYVGNPVAEEIWEFAHVESGSGFNFHNMYIDVLVENGLAGGLIFLSLIVCFVRRIFSLQNFGLGSAEGFACMLFTYMFLQTFLESGWFSQFTISHFLLCVAWVYLSEDGQFRTRRFRWS